MLLTSLSNVGVVDLEVCCPIFGIFHFAPRYLYIIDRSKLSVGRVPHSTMLEILKIFWNGYHLLLQLLMDKVNYLLIVTAGNLWTAIVHRLWIQTGGSCSMVGLSEDNCL